MKQILTFIYEFILFGSVITLPILIYGGFRFGNPWMVIIPIILYPLVYKLWNKHFS